MPVPWSNKKTNPLPRQISVAKAKSQFSALLEGTRQNQDEIIIKSRGNPKGVIISYDTYEKLQTWREQERRQKALQELNRLAATIQARNRELTSEQAETLADRFTRELFQEMVDEGKIRFQE